MKLRVLFFGATSDIAGTRSVEIDVEPASTSGDVVDHILKHHPRLSAHRLLFAINMEYGTGSEILKDGDELAIFTAVSGG